MLPGGGRRRGNGMAATGLLVEIGDRLRLRREELGMTQRQFVAKYNIPLESYKKYETGDAVIAQKYWEKIISVITHMVE